MGRSLHNLSPSLGLACKSFLISASKYICKSFLIENIFTVDICVEIYFFICSLTDPTTLVTVGPLTPAGHLAIPLLWGKLFRQKFCVFWLLITPLHLKSHYFTTASSRLERVTQRDTSKASLTAVNILFLFLPPRALLRLFGNNNLHLSFRGW